MQFFRKRGGAAPGNASRDDLREQRLEEIKKICERFTFDLGLLIAGHKIRLEEYVEPEVAARLRASIEPFLATGDAMRPNFGEYAELRVEGDLTNATRPISAQIEFDDSSMRETATGSLVQLGRRRMRLTLTLNGAATMVTDFTLVPAG